MPAGATDVSEPSLRELGDADVEPPGHRAGRALGSLRQPIAESREVTTLLEQRLEPARGLLAGFAARIGFGDPVPQRACFVEPPERSFEQGCAVGVEPQPHGGIGRHGRAVREHVDDGRRVASAARATFPRIEKLVPALTVGMQRAPDRRRLVEPAAALQRTRAMECERSRPCRDIAVADRERIEQRERVLGAIRFRERIEQGFERCGVGGIVAERRTPGADGLLESSLDGVQPAEAALVGAALDTAEQTVQTPEYV
jgi:hypothetical protein